MNEQQNKGKPVQVSASDGARMAHVDPSKSADTTGVYQVRTWECPACKIRVIQGDPCPNCKRSLLLD